MELESFSVTVRKFSFGHIDGWLHKKTIWSLNTKTPTIKYRRVTRTDSKVMSRWGSLRLPCHVAELLLAHKMF